MLTSAKPFQAGILVAPNLPHEDSPRLPRNIPVSVPTAVNATPAEAPGRPNVASASGDPSAAAQHSGVLRPASAAAP